MAKKIRYDGKDFTLSSTVVTMPREWVEKESGDLLHVHFGKVCKPDAKGAVKTDWECDGEPVYAKPIPTSGHTATNVAHGPDVTP